jgi:antitoxin HicB
MTPQEYLQQPYARVVIPVEPNGYHAELLEFYGCFAQGQTIEEAYKNLELAAESWIENALALGHEVPQPSSAIDYSGRIVLRLPQGVHQQAARFAERDGASLNTYLVSAVSSKIGAEEFYTVLAEKFEKQIMQSVYSAFYSLYGLTAKRTGDRITRRVFKADKTANTVVPQIGTGIL